jgi:hypothetical protein
MKSASKIPNSQSQIRTRYVLFRGVPGCFLGGGSPKGAQLVLDENSKIREKLEGLGVVFRSSTLTANVQMLLDTDADYILLIETHNSTVRLLKVLRFQKR